MIGMITMPALALRMLILPALLAILVAMPVGQDARAVEIQQVKSDGGLTAWLVEDYTVPIITVSLRFKGGSVQDPEGREGMANLLSALFDEGAGPYDSKQFQAKLEKLGVTLSYSDGRDSFSGLMRTLREDSENAFEMMRLSLTELHFEDAAIERMREAIKAGLIQRERNPRVKAGRALRDSLYGDHPYARPARGTVETLSAISRDELRTHFSKLFARDNLTVSVVGAISAKETADMLDRVFGDLPQRAQLREIETARMQFGDTITVEHDSPQAVIAMALPGVKRDSPKFFAAYLANHILGGGVFSSRLYDEVREKRGLAYSVYSRLTSRDHAAYIAAGSATRADRAAETIAIMREQIADLAENGPSQDELDAAKKYVIGSYAIRNLDTSAKMARALTAMQTENLGVDYIDRRAALIGAVTLDQVKAAAAKLLSAEPTVVVVGPQNS